MHDDTERFDNWFPVKRSLAARNIIPPTAEREIWWCSIGFNVGSEAYGKGSRFTRPVLILKKLNYATFIGIPMSSKLKIRDDYHILNFNGKDVALMLGEIRKFDSRRLADKMGTLSEEKFKQVWLATLKCIQPRAV
jgi:mRNA-degrading endonuclease toxin of MazEF toxin-antitoxin module